MKHTEQSVEQRFQRSLKEARMKLASLSVAQGRQPNLQGLNGWVFEQTLRSCLEDELAENGASPAIEEQVALEGRARVDLLIDPVAIEIKAAGFFGNEVERYRKYRSEAEKRGWFYFYVTRQESHRPFRDLAVGVFGRKRAFFLDRKGDWKRFVAAVLRATRKKRRLSAVS